MARAFGSDENDIHVFRWKNGFVMHCETVREQECFPLDQVGCDVRFVNSSLLGVRQSNKDYVRLLNGFRCGNDFESFVFGNGDRFATFVKADDDVASTFLGKWMQRHHRPLQR